jgi:hypothetical protein
MANEIRQNTTDYDHPHDPNLLNLHKAMEYDLGGKPMVRVAAKLSGPSIAGQVSAFGEPLAISPTAVIQLDGIYGTTNDVIQTYTNGTGSSAGSVNGMFRVHSGTSQGGYGVLRSKRFVRYRPGQGIQCRLTAGFTTGVAGSGQFAGLANQENRIGFGYDGTRFGVVRSTGGKAVILTMVMDTAPNAGQTATITLNGVAYTVALTAGTAAHAVTEIVNRVGGYGTWLVQQTDGAMLWLGPVGVANGAFSFTSTGNATATFTVVQAGVNQTHNWTYQEDWNIDKLDGSGTIDANPSGMLLDPTKLNVYQVSMRWLGAGVISYAIEDELSGTLVYVHREHYVNQHTTPHTANPSFKVQYNAVNTTNTTDIQVYGGSMYAAIEGTVFLNELTRSASTSKTGLVKNVIHHMMTIKNSVVTNGIAGANNGNYVLNTKEAIVKSLSVSVQSTDPVEVYLYFEPAGFSAAHEYYAIPRCNEVKSTVTGTFNGTSDTPIYTGFCGINGTINVDLSQYRITIPPGSWLSIAVKSTNSISPCIAALTWSED